MIDEFINKSRCFYLYGSRVYGTHDSLSDYDYISIVDKKEKEQYINNGITINYYEPSEFQNLLNEQEISAIECYFLPPIFKLKEEIKFNYIVNLQKLRISISKKSSNSWVKAKKKLIVEKDYDLNIARKSLFHSIRIVKFGIQISKFGKIVNYQECNELWKDIKKLNTWNEMFFKYKKLYNSILTEFRLITPKI